MIAAARRILRGMARRAERPADALNACARRLWKDESGVVLAFTVVVFLTLFMFSAMVYALGEQFRRRIVLQNAADAAAYSAAVVQADAISRIAALNRAMAWTYMQMCKRQMDHVLHVWLAEVVRVHEPEGIARRAQYEQLFSGFNCRDAQHVTKRWWVGEGNSPDNQDAVLLNKNQWVPFQKILNQVESFRPEDEALKARIEQDWDTANDLGDKEAEILNNLPSNIRVAVERMVRINGVEPDAGVSYALIEDVNPIENSFRLYNDEEMFMKASADNAESKDLGNGHDTWFPPTEPIKGWPNRYREYKQQANCLIAEWESHVEGWRTWAYCPKCKFAHCFNWINQTTPHWGGNGIRGEDVRPDDKYFKTVVLRPQSLKPEFFCDDTIVVGVARRTDNPFRVMLGNDADLGLFRAFTPAGGNHTLALAAARAGIRDGRGTYNSSIDYSTIICDTNALPDPKTCWQHTGWVGMLSENLKQTDWDAVLLPLNRAFSGRNAAWIFSRIKGDPVPPGSTEASGEWLDASSASGAKILDRFSSSGEWHKIGSGPPDVTGPGAGRAEDLVH